MLRKLLLVVLVLSLAFAATGCMDYSALLGDMTAMQNDNPDEPKETLGPLTAPMFEDASALYQYYNDVKIGDMLEDVKAKFGEPTVTTDENGDTYTWKMEDGYGFSAVFYNSGRLRAKVLLYDDLRQMGKLSRATGLDSITTLNKDFTLDMVKAMLGGRGMEIMRMAADSSTNPETQLLYLWIDEEGSFAQILFNKDKKVESVNYYYVED